MSETKTLFLAWQDKAQTRKWFPVGRLDAGPKSLYRFRYVSGAERARKESGFEPLYDFPEFHTKYESRELFPLFKNRVLAPDRPDFNDYLRRLDLSPEHADPIEILSVDGGYKATDSFEVFPMIERGKDGAFRCRFFLHGWRHVSQAAQRRIESLTPGENLHVAIELTNAVDREVVQIQTADYHMIGWAPRYLAGDLLQSIAEAPGDYRAKVIRVNPVPEPSKQRLLVELTGHWPDQDPMTTGDFRPLAK